MPADNKPKRTLPRPQVDHFVEAVFQEDLHAKRIESLQDGLDGVLHAASLGVRAIGHGLAAANGLAPRHAIK